jgi:MFS family permease
VFPLLFTTAGLTLAEVSLLAAIYPATWGVFQLITGPLSDRLGRRPLIVNGMLLQAAALISMAMVQGFVAWALSLVALGVGTALVYPTLIAAVGDVAHPSWRGAAVGVYRLWRDLGYVVGAVLAGILTDAIGASAAIIVIGVLTGVSGLAFGLRFDEMRQERVALRVAA